MAEGGGRRRATVTAQHAAATNGAGVVDEPEPPSDIPGAVEPEGLRFAVVTLFHGRAHDEIMDPRCVDQIRRQLDDQQFADRENVQIDVWLESPGGSADSAYKLMLILRHYAKWVRVVIPDYAKSAATLLALGADEIFMGPAAELGPLDAQIRYEHEGVTISALDLANSVEHLAMAAVTMAVYGGLGPLTATGLSRKDVLTGMLDFAGAFFQPMVNKLDPSMVHRANSQLKVASEYAERLLRMRTNPANLAALASVPEKLVRDYPHHGFIIDAAEAASLGLPVRPASDYNLWEAALTAYKAYDQSGLPVLQVRSDLANGDGQEQ